MDFFKENITAKKYFLNFFRILPEDPVFGTPDKS
jgi:hypothetical protein